MFSDKQAFQDSFKKRLEQSYSISFQDSTRSQQFVTLSSMVREYISSEWIETNERYRKSNKQVYYLSIEFLLGRLLGQNLINLGLYEKLDSWLSDLNIPLHELEEIEPDAALGNGGLGRLAACFLDSLASLNLPGHGCGIRYKHGLFEQKMVDGFQMELPENWLRYGYVWEIRKSDLSVDVPFWGSVDVIERDGAMKFRHVDAEYVRAVPHDMPVVGYGGETINTLRLWSAEMSTMTPMHDVLKYKRETEAISEFLYPDDSNDEGKILRLKQQYFLVSASIRSILRRFLSTGGELKELHEHVAIHINDTHPVLAIPELMRLLLDEYQLSWEEAWHITEKTFAYTNHTTLSEALERWPIRLFKPLLPRIFMIVEEINERFCRSLWGKYPGDWSRIEKMAVIANGEVRMAHLAIAGSHSVNGVARLHTEILKNREMNDFYQFYPKKFNNKTNGITHRRWLLKANPELTSLLTETIGDGFHKNAAELSKLAPYADDAAFQEKLWDVKMKRKEILAKRIFDQNGIQVDPSSIFDVQVKRLHAYKRQLLNVLHILSLYNRVKADSSYQIPPRTFVFGAKASPGYFYAKRIIKLIHSVADLVNNDPATKGLLTVVFMENYRVSLAEDIIPAADLSEQISTASKEASGTGNMKFMMNGAITIGTLDGANVEILEQTGPENILIFGLKAEEVMAYDREGGYRSMDYYHHSPLIRRTLDQLVDGTLDDKGLFNIIYDSLLGENDQYFVLKDFESYGKTQEEAGRIYTNDPERWRKMMVHNISGSGIFSSDRTIQEYAKGIWHI
ncbi:glycogen/starch/alpha-glucan phosphorylase [Domibacillus sp. DTU_2020_1001157_1_SI_ALB_TIR_016]|uniref:glycogen/starch/alpha-glucan phosphorylase n=1 Tax=Domibacillus sp. DTU_2020_1001157_1_SI_ALB_TIR_016 TaxID=3077789 RepID=UPI0028E50094|nr:glycogen/starch/alpha-glucan phosphorylase [Domibacillus sp. DTU_2020_1001157_1_SI_ALB_TIR_016]WNS81663.1 glycogen/starch/alpha-glucan phosphorylase [Domibacillus sp. DTU_2020_1001157_1_SI_ALB_TIR_016]